MAIRAGIISTGIQAPSTNRLTPIPVDHVVPTTGFLIEGKDVAVGMAQAADGSIYVSVLVGVYDPFNPEKTGP